MTESQPRAGSNQARFQQRIRHSGHSLHGHNGMSNRSCGHVVLAQGAQGSQLSQVLKGVGLLRGNQLSPFPPLQLAGTDLQNPQHIRAAIAAHSFTLPWLVRLGLGFPTRIPGSGPGRVSWNSDGRTALAAIMPRIAVDKQPRMNAATKSAWITGT